MTPRLISFFGLVTMLALAWLSSDNRRRMNFRLILSGVALQLALGAVVLRTQLKETIFDYSGKLILGLIDCANAGARFVFGESFFSTAYLESYHAPPFFVGVLPMVIFFSSLTAVLFHLGVLQWAVRIMARVMVWVMDVSGTESLCASANVFLGMTTAPLMIRPYLSTMTQSEIMAMMAGGMATAAGSTLPAYVAMGADAGHLMVASLMAAPASLVVAKIMVPETQPSPTKGAVKVEVPREDANLLDAACRGASDGLKLALNIAAMLIAFIALVYLLNWMLSGVSMLIDWGLGCFADAGSEPMTVQRLLGGQTLSLQWLLGWVFSPIAWLLGIEWKDATVVGTLLGEKTVFNEFFAFAHLGQLRESISPRSYTITTYALCGFANFGSIAVMIGGISGLAPDRRADFAKFGLRSLIAGALASFMTAAVAGMLI